jgi:hypothetical protein
VKRPITKAHIRTEIAQQINDFLDKGGKVAEVERGKSGRDNPDGPLNPDSTSFQQRKIERTYLPEVVAAIDARRKQKPIKTKPSKRGPRKKTIYDDFGEPLREVWVEE